MKTNDSSSFLNLFGEQLSIIRKSKNLSYRALAQLCDIDHSQISKIEKGQINLSLSTIYELAKGLNIHPKELFEFSINFEEK